MKSEKETFYNFYKPKNDKHLRTSALVITLGASTILLRVILPKVVNKSLCGAIVVYNPLGGGGGGG